MLQTTVPNKKVYVFQKCPSFVINMLQTTVPNKKAYFYMGP